MTKLTEPKYNVIISKLMIVIPVNIYLCTQTAIQISETLTLHKANI